MDPLRVLVQVNTSSESSKSGLDTEGLTELLEYVIKDCSHLKFLGLMCIGYKGSLEDFKVNSI